jgi:multidrug resistance efflux pump
MVHQGFRWIAGGLLGLALIGGNASVAPDGRAGAPAAPVGLFLDELVRVPSRQDGIVRSIAVKKGDTVEEGQLLARLDDGPAAAEVRILEARLSAARSEHAEALKREKLAWNRLEMIKRLPGCGSLDDVHAFHITFRRYAAEATSKEEAVNVAEQVLKQAKLILDTYEIRSPAAGVIKAVAKKKGEAVKTFETVFLLWLPN